MNLHGGSACPHIHCGAARAKAHRKACRRSRVPPRDPELLMVALMAERAREARAVGPARAAAEERRAYVEWLVQGTNTAFRTGRSQADPDVQPLPRVVRKFTPEERDAAIRPRQGADDDGLREAGRGSHRRSIDRRSTGLASRVKRL